MFIALATGGGVQVEFLAYGAMKSTIPGSIPVQSQMFFLPQLLLSFDKTLFLDVCLFFLSSISLDLQFPEQLAKQTLILPSIL